MVLKSLKEQMNQSVILYRNDLESGKIENTRDIFYYLVETLGIEIPPKCIMCNQVIKGHEVGIYTGKGVVCSRKYCMIMYIKGSGKNGKK